MVKLKGYSESLTPEETAQMDEMRAQDKIAPEAEIVTDPEPEPKEKPTEAKEPEDKPEVERNKMVPHAALHEERELRKAAERAQKETEQNFARADERIKMILAMQEKPVEKQVIPNADTDPLGAVKYNAKEVQEIRNWQMQQDVNERNRQQAAQISSQAGMLESQYRATNPDYDDATAFLRQSRLNELKAFGLNDQAAQQTIIQETMAVAMQALQSGQNPAKIVHDIAKSRGYVAKQTETGEQKIARIAQGQRENLSLGNSNGSAPKKGITGKDLGTMSDEDFAKFYKTMSKQQQKDVFGD